MSPRYEGDVAYEVWMRGGNPDAVTADRCIEDERAGLWPEEAASRYLRRRDRDEDDDR